MKRLGVYAIIPILFIIIAGYIPAEKTYAATSQAAAANINTTDPAALMTWASNYYFVQALTALSNEVNSKGASHGKGDPARAKEYSTFLAENKAAADATRAAKSTFETTFASAQGTSKTATVIYKEALTAANQTLTTQKTSNTLLQGTYSAPFIDAFSQQLNTEASAQEFLNAVSNGVALSSAAQNASAAVTGAANKKSPPLPCDLFTGAIIGCIDIAVTYIIKTVLLELAGWFLWLTANILNYAMKIGIFEFKMFAPDTIYGMWLVVRQAVSLFIFFAGLFIGFMSVIGKSEDFKKYIAFFVVFGLFVNFSYPIVRLMIDVSNVVSLQIYETTLGSGVILANTDGPETAGARIVSALGLNGLAAGATTLPGSGATSDFIKQITTTPGALLAVIFVAYSGYVLFMMAALIIARTVLLVFLIIASPVLLVDTVVPALGEKAAWLRKQFFSQLAVAPVFTIMLALTLRFLEVFQTSGIVTMSGAQASSIVIFFNIAIMIAMMHITLKVTKSVAGSIGEGVTAWAGKAGGLATGMAFRATAGATGFVGRQTVGRAAGALAGSEAMKNMAGTWGGDLLGKGLSKVGNAKYDLRNMPGAGKAASFFSTRGMGAGTTKSFAEQQAERHAAVMKQANDMTDDTARQAFLDDKLGRGRMRASTLKDPLGEVGARAGTRVATKFGFNMPQTAAEKARASFEKGDTDMLKKYATANKKEREKMMEDDKNKAYKTRFAQVDAYLDPKTAQADKDAIKATMEKTTPGAASVLQAGEQKQAETKTRNETRLADYGTADAAGKEAIRTAFANDEEALEQIDILQRLSTIDSSSSNAVADKVKALQDLKAIAGEDMVFKVIARDTHEGITDRDTAITQKQTIYQQVFTDPTTGAVDPRVPSNAVVLGRQYDEAITKRDGKDAAMQQAQLDALKINAQASQDLAKLLQQLQRGGGFGGGQQASSSRAPSYQAASAGNVSTTTTTPPAPQGSPAATPSSSTPQYQNQTQSQTTTPLQPLNVGPSVAPVPIAPLDGTTSPSVAPTSQPPRPPAAPPAPPQPTEPQAAPRVPITTP